MKKILITFVAAAVVLTAAHAMAQTTDTSPLNVQAVVNAQCNIQSVTDLDFADYDVTSATPDDDGVGDVTFACTRATNYDVYITGLREITDGTDTLTYELYADAGRTTVFPNAMPGVVSPPAPDNGPIVQGIWGRIGALQDVQAGTYTGSVTVTIEY